MGIILGVLNKPCLVAGLRVASGETPGQPDDGYGTVVGGTVISAPPPFTDLIGTRNAHIDDPSSLDGHPDTLVQVSKNLRSTAFGRYQILYRSAQAQNMTDSSPAGQGAYANNLLTSRGTVGAAEGGHFRNAMKDAGKEWASMPGSPYGQGGISLNAAASTFLGALKSAQECKK
jgi:muramidase (phage lysozyme)